MNTTMKSWVRVPDTMGLAYQHNELPYGLTIDIDNFTILWGIKNQENPVRLLERPMPGEPTVAILAWAASKVLELENLHRI